MLRTCHQNDLVETLALQYILPTRTTKSLLNRSIQSESYHVYLPGSTGRFSLGYASSIARWGSNIITTPLEGEVDRIRLEFSKLKIPLRFVSLPTEVGMCQAC